MGYNQEAYRRIRTEYETKYLRAREDADRRRAQIEQELPAIAALHRRMAGIGPEIMRISLQAASPAERQAAIDALKQQQDSLLAQRDALLADAGYPRDYLAVRYECDACGDTGYLEDGKMCQCMRTKLAAAAYESSGLGSLLHEQRFDNFSLNYYAEDARTHRAMTYVYDTMRAYAENFTTGDATDAPSENLLLIGGTGLGKTHLSSALAQAVLSRGFDVLYVSALDLFSAFEAERFGNGGSQLPLIDRFYRCDLLLIDDLGTEVSNQFTVSCLYNIINTRLNTRRPTVISTNVMQDELRRRYWDRITSRLFGEYRVLLFLGTDVRAQKMKSV